MQSTSKKIVSHDVTLLELRTARYQCARLIKEIDHGHKLLPIFERLDNEISRMEKQEQLLTKAMVIANDNFNK